MKTFTAHMSFEANEEGEKARYEAGQSYEIDDTLADFYSRKGLGEAESFDEEDAG